MNVFKKVHRKTAEALSAYEMLAPGDRLLIGVSGGKDSLVVSHVLAEKRKRWPFPVELEACHVVTDLSPRDEAREENLAELFAGFEIPFHVRLASVMERLDPSRSFNCFFCAMQRRIALRKTAAERGCNKIVYGHHLDDIIETLLMNMFFKAEISTMPAKLEMDEHDLEILRPLALTKEREVATYARHMGFEDLSQPCPYAHDTRRAAVKKLVSELCLEDERIRDNLSASLDRVKLGYLRIKKRGVHSEGGG